MYIWPCPEPMSKEEILKRAHSFWLEVVSQFGMRYLLRRGVDFNEVYEAIIYPKFEICLDTTNDLGVDDFGDIILGRYIPKENTALVNKKLFEQRDPRTVFTEWHEVAGHGVLQGEFLRQHLKNYDKLYTTEKSMKLIDNSFEWQANTFAANVAAPRIYVYCLFEQLFGTRGKIPFRGACKYSLCFNEHHWEVYANSPFELAWKIATRIKRFFWGLSAEVIAYQLLEVAIDNGGYRWGSHKEKQPFPILGDVVSNYIKDKYGK